MLATPLNETTGLKSQAAQLAARQIKALMEKHEGTTPELSDLAYMFAIQEHLKKYSPVGDGVN
jgi:hypothetical protein